MEVLIFPLHKPCRISYDLLLLKHWLPSFIQYCRSTSNWRVCSVIIYLCCDWKEWGMSMCYFSWFLTGAAVENGSFCGWPLDTNYVIQWNKPKLCILPHRYPPPLEFQKCYYTWVSPLLIPLLSNLFPHCQAHELSSLYMLTSFLHLLFHFRFLWIFCLCVSSKYILCPFTDPFQFPLHCFLYPQAGCRGGQVVKTLLECVLSFF